MFVCSVSTVIFNANPLLRYDGYYILADLMEIPNLRQKASTILSRKLGDWCLGLEEPDDPFLPQRNQMFFALYTVAAAIYRWLVLFGIIWFLVQGVRAVRPEGHQPDAGLRVDVQPGGHAALQGGQVLLRSRKARQSETQERQHHAGDPGRRGDVRHLLPAAVSRHLHAGAQAARRRPGLCRRCRACWKRSTSSRASRSRRATSWASCRASTSNWRSATCSSKIVTNTSRLKRAAPTSELRNLRRPAKLPKSARPSPPCEKQLKEKQDDKRRLALVAPADGIVLPPPEVPAQPQCRGRAAQVDRQPVGPEEPGGLFEATRGCFARSAIRTLGGQPGDRPGRHRLHPPRPARGDQARRAALSHVPHPDQPRSGRK